MSSKEDVDAERCPESGDGTHCDCWWDGAACCRCGSPADPDVCPDCGASDCLQHLATHKRLKREMADAMHDIDRMTDTTTELATDNEHLRAALQRITATLGKIEQFRREQYERISPLGAGQAGSYARGYENGLREILGALGGILAGAAQSSHVEKLTRERDRLQSVLGAHVAELLEDRDRLRAITDGCPVCSELVRNTVGAHETGASIDTHQLARIRAEFENFRRGLCNFEDLAFVIEVAPPLHSLQGESPHGDYKQAEAIEPQGSRSESPAHSRYAVECKCGKKFLTYEVGTDHVEYCTGKRVTQETESVTLTKGDNRG